MEVLAVIGSMIAALDDSSIETILGPRLSSNASILFPGSPQFADATLRWQEWEHPSITVVVEIKYANEQDIPFLAITGGHGAIRSLGNVKHGIEIWMRQMNSVTINPDGNTATIGGGVLSKELVDALWAADKQTVTGLCECTGVLGPLLGGGHGLLQGYYGLLADNLVSARLVLANGSAIAVSSASHPDLFWAVRGAGHNFGIVTEFTYKIYDVPANETWSYESFIFTGEHVEAIAEKLNDISMDGTRPPELFTFSFFAWNPETSSSGPCIFLYILYKGSPSSLHHYTAPFHSLNAASPTQSGITTLPGIASLTGNGNDGLACGHGTTSLRFPIGLKKYNVTAQRAVYDKFAEITTVISELRGSFFLFEGYAVGGVKRISEESTAFPHRRDNLLVSPVMVYAPNATLDPIAIQAGNDIRQVLQEAEGTEEMHVYINYALGDERWEEIYGYEEWRMVRLRELKSVYDPDERFRFYAPIH
ncbi:FAD binding domain protein [Stipitochalara longipes BDJ]|nr:FAD binding domain protein [Stipitochalara longipes BDJ]